MIAVEPAPQINPSYSPQIERAKKIKSIAGKIAEISLKCLAAVAIATAVFYASPVVPMTLVIAIPILLFFGMMFNATGGGGLPNPPSPGAQEVGGSIFSGFLKVSIGAGVEWGKIIYTAKIAVLAGLVNAAAAALCLPVAAVSGGIYLYQHKQIENLSKAL